MRPEFDVGNSQCGVAEGGDQHGIADNIARLRVILVQGGAHAIPSRAHDKAENVNKELAR